MIEFKHLNNAKKLGFFTDSFIQEEYEGCFHDYALAIELLHREGKCFVDADNTEWGIVNFFIDQENKFLIWVEWGMNTTRRIEKHEYYLCVITPDFHRIKKEIETYNPYFGISFESISVVNGVITLKYRDKHDARQMVVETIFSLSSQ